MSEALKQLLHCSLVSAGFRVVDYALSEQAITAEGEGRTGTNVKIDVDGELTGASAEEFAENLRAFIAGTRLVDGQDFQIWSNGTNLEYRLLAAQMIDGGPWLGELKVEKQRPDSACLKRVTFSVQGMRNRSDDDEQPPDQDRPQSVKVNTVTRADKPRQIAYSGKFTGPSSTARFTRYADGLRTTYPATKWIESRQVNSTFSDTQVEFTVSYVELATQISLVAGAFTVIDMEKTRRTDRDEKGRKVVTLEFDVLLDQGGDPVAARDACRAAALVELTAPVQGGQQRQPTILRETASYTVHHEIRVRTSFTVIEGGDGNDLLDFEQTLEGLNSFVENRSPVKGYGFIGRNPILVRSKIEPYRYVQSGRAVGVNRFPKPPRPIFGETNLAEQPTLKTRVLNLVEWETSWSYVWLFATVQTDPNRSLLLRPAANAVEWLNVT